MCLPSLTQQLRPSRSFRPPAGQLCKNLQRQQAGPRQQHLLGHDSWTPRIALSRQAD